VSLLGSPMFGNLRHKLSGPPSKVFLAKVLISKGSKTRFKKDQNLIPILIFQMVNIFTISKLKGVDGSSPQGGKKLCLLWRGVHFSRFITTVHYKFISPSS